MSKLFIPGICCLILLNSGCATVPGQGTRDAFRALLTEAAPATTDINTVRAPTKVEIDALTQDPSLEKIIITTLRSHPQMRRVYAQLDIADADFYEASRPANPRLSLGYADSNERGTVNQITFGVVQNIANLIWLNTRRRFAHSAGTSLRYQLAEAVYALVHNAQQRYYQFVGSLHQHALQQRHLEASNLAAALAKTYYSAGNISRLELAQVDTTSARAAVAERESFANTNRHRHALNRAIGLPLPTLWVALPTLPPPQIPVLKRADIVEVALKHRLILRAADLASARHAESLAMTKRFRWLGNFQAGVGYEREPSGNRLLGPTFNLELPLFNLGADRVLRAQAKLDTADADRALMQQEIEHDIYMAFENLQRSLERIAIHQTRLVPARRRLVEETERLQGYMLASPFDLLDVKGKEFLAQQHYFDALTSYWLARSDLERAAGVSLEYLPASETNANIPAESEASTRFNEPHAQHASGEES